MYVRGAPIAGCQTRGVTDSLSYRGSPKNTKCGPVGQDVCRGVSVCVLTHFHDAESGRRIMTPPWRVRTETRHHHQCVGTQTHRGALCTYRASPSQASPLKLSDPLQAKVFPRRRITMADQGAGYGASDERMCLCLGHVCRRSFFSFPITLSWVVSSVLASLCRRGCARIP